MVIVTAKSFIIFCCVFLFGCRSLPVQSERVLVFEPMVKKEFMTSQDWAYWYNVAVELDEERSLKELSGVYDRLHEDSWRRVASLLRLLYADAHNKPYGLFKGEIDLAFILVKESSDAVDLIRGMENLYPSFPLIKSGDMIFDCRPPAFGYSVAPAGPDWRTIEDCVDSSGLIFCSSIIMNGSRFGGIKNFPEIESARNLIEALWGSEVRFEAYLRSQIASDK